MYNANWSSVALRVQFSSKCCITRDACLYLVLIHKGHGTWLGEFHTRLQKIPELQML